MEAKNLHFLGGDPIGKYLNRQGATGLGKVVGRAQVRERMTTQVDGGSGDIDEILCAPFVSYCIQCYDGKTKFSPTFVFAGPSERCL